MMRSASCVQRGPIAHPIPLLLLLLGLLPALAEALPLFARQTGQACAACHVSFPELTPYGRWFKLNGYTIGKPAALPLAIMGNFGYERIAQPYDATGAKQDNRDGIPTLAAVSVFAGGRLSENAGAFLQWTYTPYNYNYADPGKFGGYSHADNMDVRLVGRSEPGDSGFTDWVYGLSLHNNPTVQDVWNGTPAFGFPWQPPQFSNALPATATLIDGGLAQQVMGVGAYAYWQRTIYAELALYRDAQGPFSVMTHNIPVASPLQGNNPYARLAYNREWGANSLEVGAYGARFKVLTSGHGGDPTDRFTDEAVDIQYQYITDPHTFSVIGTAIHERQSLDYTFGVAAASSNPNNTLDTRRLKASYFYQHIWGGTLQLFRTTGSADALLYPVNGSAVPDTSGYVAELDYQPIPNVRVQAQYTGYRRFNGASSNIDGLGRSPHDNNVFYLDVWFAY